MLDGDLYLANDAQLVQMRKRARKLTRFYNQTTEDDDDRRSEILRELFGKTGQSFKIEPPFHCDYGSHISIGEEFYMNFGGIILDCAHVTIGNQVMCAPNVQLYAATHPLDAKLRCSGPELAKPIKIGNRVWLGGGVIVCPGVTIGDNTVIGAGSVVVKDIPANVVAAGNPCRVIRQLPVPDD
mgnify:CR=1 FL=1